MLGTGVMLGTEMTLKSKSLPSGPRNLAEETERQVLLKFNNTLKVPW